MYIAASINLVGQRGKSTGQMPKLAGKCPVTDCYYEHCILWLLIEDLGGWNRSHDKLTTSLPQATSVGK